MNKYFYKKLTITLLAVGIFINGPIIYADVIYLKSGRTARGKIIREKAGKVTIRLKSINVTMSCDLTSIRSILYERSEKEMIKIYKEKVKKINPKSFEAHYNLGLFCERYNLFNEAEKEFKKALALNPQMKKISKKRLKRIEKLSLLKKRADDKFKNKRYNEAKILYENFLKLYNNNKAKKKLKSIEIFYQNEAEKRLESIKRFYQIAKIYKQKADRLFKESCSDKETKQKNKRDKAFKLYRRVIITYPEIGLEIKSDKPMLHFKLGRYFAEIDLNDFMEKSFKTALNLNPRYETLIKQYTHSIYEKKAFAEYTQGKKAYLQGEYNLAIEKLENMINIFGKSSMVPEAKQLLIITRQKIQKR
jgi:tetratricopeptide (TPR) repeat protein